MMPYKAGWALGLVMLFSQLANAQDGQPEKIPLPKSPNINTEPQTEPLIYPAIDDYGRGLAVYADADYLHWWVHHGPAPILLTTAPNNGINPNGLTGGILGQPGTTTLFTGRDLDFGGISGVRGRAGVNFGFWSVELGGFYLPKTNFEFNAVGNPNGTPLLTIPFLDAATGSPSALDLSSQDIFGNPYIAGGIRIQSDLLVWGYEANLIAHSIREGNRAVDLLFGFRAMELTENLRIDQTISPALEGNVTVQFPRAGLGTDNYYNVAANTPVYIVDRFGTRNQFYGGQVGGRFAWDFGPLSAELNAKVALGVTHQQASIDGSTNAATVVHPRTGTVLNNITTPGGVFALQGNTGSFSQNQFTMVPEIGVNLKYALTSQLFLRVGYSAMYWSNVARPGGQIDPVLNTKLIPTGAQLPFPNLADRFVPGQEQGRPYFAFRDTAFWAHGINVGMEFRY
jgi:hypothetical protein